MKQARKRMYMLYDKTYHNVSAAHVLYTATSLRAIRKAKTNIFNQMDTVIYVCELAMNKRGIPQMKNERRVE